MRWWFFARSGPVQSLADWHHVDAAGMLISCTDVEVRAPAARCPISTLQKARALALLAFTLILLRDVSLRSRRVQPVTDSPGAHPGGVRMAPVRALPLPTELTEEVDLRRMMPLAHRMIGLPRRGVAAVLLAAGLLEMAAARAGGFRGAARLGSIGAAWLLLLVAPWWVPPAEAQDTCAPLYGEDIWCTTMTVAQMTTRVSGFSSVQAGDVPPGGSLADVTFTYAGTNYTVRRIQLFSSTDPISGETGYISFDVRPLTFPSLALVSTNLGFQVGSTRLLFDHAEPYFGTYLDWNLGSLEVIANQYINWPDGEQLIVRIFEVQEPGAPRVRATVGDWQATLAWTPPRDDGGVPILGYEYRYRKQTDAAYPESWTEVDVDYGRLSFELRESVTLRELDAVPYVFQVRARNGKYPGPPAEVSATPTEPSNVVSIWPNHLLVREDAGAAVLTVSLDGPAASALSVPWRTQDDRAEAPNDYGARQDTVTFAVGETRKIIAVPIVDDAAREDPVNDVGETFFVLLSSGQGYGLGAGGAIVEIHDNDGDGTEPPGDGPVTPDSPGVTVSPSALTVDEGTTVTYTVRLDSEPTGTVTVTPSSDNPDVTFSPATLTFTTSNWATAQTVTVTAAQDTDTAEDTATIRHAVAGEDYGSVTAPSVPVTVPDDDVDPDPDPDPDDDTPGANVSPTADAGPDQLGVWEGALVMLDGSGSSDPDDDPLRYRWNQLSGQSPWCCRPRIRSQSHLHGPAGADGGCSAELQSAGHGSERSIRFRYGDGHGGSGVAEPPPPEDRIYYFQHLAVGASWQTTITYINYSREEVTCQIDFISDHGTPLMVSFAELGTVDSRTDVLPPGGCVHQETNVDLNASLARGWARATCSGPVKASLLYRRHNSEGAPTAEAGLNATAVPATRFVTFAEQGEDQFGTGVAYANPSAISVPVTFTARDAAGEVLASVVRTLSPGGHDAHGMSELFDLTSFTGSLEVTSTEPIVSLSLNFEADPVFSSLPPGELDAAAQGSTTYYFPHLAVGASWQTTITYINYSREEVSCQTDFISDHGTPLLVSFAALGTVVSRTDVLPPGGSVHQETNVDLNASLARGWARATCSGPVKASLLYRRRNSEGIPTGEAGVNATAVPATRFVTFAEQGEDQFGTGVAYANPSPNISVPVTFTARDAAGEVLASVVRTLSPGGHDAHGMESLFGPSSFTGSIEVTSTEPIVSLSLNFEADPVFSSLPPGELDAAAQ